MGNLTAAKVRNAKPGLSRAGKPTKRAYIDGDGLFLLVGPNGVKSWILRVQVNGKRHGSKSTWRRGHGRARHR